MQKDIRNVAIIAHVDHGKTTLIDSIFKQFGHFKATEDLSERLMDNNQLEKERGITIFSKCTSISYDDKIINIVDTPGHADFGGEVERILNMVNGCILLVDSAEGVMAQTKFVLSKALEYKIPIIVIINKIDKPDARPDYVIDDILELFMDLGATDEQCDFPVLYASGRDGWASTDKDKKGTDLSPLIETIAKNVNQPKHTFKDDKFRFLATMLEHDNFLGRMLTGRVYSGVAKVNMQVDVLDLSGNIVEKCKITKIKKSLGTNKIDIDEAVEGDIVTIAGFTKGTVSNSVVEKDSTDVIPAKPIDKPTLGVVIGPNTSPFAGKEGSKVTSTMIKERLTKEAENNVAISIETNNGEYFEVKGRGELQLGILIETMRREGFELSISRPQVLFKEEGGKKLEPIEEIILDVDDEHTGTVIQKLQTRKCDMLEMKPYGTGRTRLVFHAPTRCILGYQTEFRNDTRGTGIFNRLFHSYAPFKGEIEKTRNGVMIATEKGPATAYSLDAFQERGIMFITPGSEVYGGMIVGEHNRDNDLPVNVIKGKQLTNVRASGTDDAIKLKPAVHMTLEECISYIQDDELIEVTPLNIRLRKRYLDPNERKKHSR